MDAECEIMYSDTYGGGEQSLIFGQWVDWLADYYASDTRIATPISKACSSCEFKTTDDERTGMKSGYKECWKEKLDWNDEDFKCPTVLDVWNLSAAKKDNLIQKRPHQNVSSFQGGHSSKHCSETG